MPLRDAPLPRMAGHLPFMRGPVAELTELRAGQIAAFGVGLGRGAEDTSLAPLGLRETSSYFGAHFSSNMKAAMDIDQRRVLDAAAVAGRIVDLGDVDFAGVDGPAGACIAALAAAIARRGAVPAMLGGSRSWVEDLRRGLSEAHGEAVSLARLRTAPSEPSGRCGPKLLAVLDLSDFASIWHGCSRGAGTGGLSLSECRIRLREIGRSSVAGVAAVGLDPTRQGLSTVKTGQRLLVTAVLELVYACLGALGPPVRHG